MMRRQLRETRRTIVSYGAKRKGTGITIRLLAAGLSLLIASGCNSGSGAKDADAQAAAAADGDSGGAHIDVMCIGDRINSPSEAFHYSYKFADASGWMDDEADITPQAMDIVTKDKSGTHTYHGVRSSEESWGSTFLVLAHLDITAMSARLDSLNGTSALRGQGAEAVNGYPATKYSIDTANENSTDKDTFETLFGKGSYDKGTVWMGQDGCAAKLVLDEGLYQTDGTIAKRHYEMARIRK